MLNLKMRLYLGILFLILGVVIHVQLGIGSAWYMYLGGLIVLLTYFLFGNVYPAFRELNQGNIEQAERLLQTVQRPEWLLKNHQAYYYFTLGMIALQKKQTGFGEQHLKKALSLGLRTNTENALAALNIAHSFFVRNEFESANEYLKKAKSFETNDLMIKENLTQLEKALDGRLN